MQKQKIFSLFFYLVAFSTVAFGDNLYVGNGSSGVTTNFSSGSNNYGNIYVAAVSGDSNDLLTVQNAGTFLEVSGSFFVGLNGAGSLTLSDGEIDSGDFTLADLSGSSGTAIVSSGTLSNNGTLVVGKAGVGSLTLNGGSVESAGLTIAAASGSGGALAINGGSFSNSGYTIIGQSGSGTLTLTAGILVDQAASVGNGAQSSGSATVSGGTWSNSSYLSIYGGSTLTISGGTLFTSNSPSVGDAVDIGFGAGVAVATVSSGLWSNQGDLQVAHYGQGILNISGGTVADANAFVGNDSNGVVNITGGLWSNSADLYIANKTSGQMMISGGEVSDRNAYIGNFGYPGSVVETGGLWSNSGNIYLGYTVGAGGTGTNLATLTISGSGTVTASQVIVGEDVADLQGTLNFGSSSDTDSVGSNPIITSEIYVSSNSSVNFYQTNTLVITNTLVNYGAINQNGSGTTVLTGLAEGYLYSRVVQGPVTINNGVLSLGSTGLVDYYSDSNFPVGSGFDIPYPNAVTVNPGGTLALGGSNQISSIVEFPTGPSPAPVIPINISSLVLNGGSLSLGANANTGGQRATSLDLGYLELTKSSIIDFSSLSGESVLNLGTITGLHGANFNPSNTLSIYNWNGGYGAYGNLGAATSMTGGSNSFTIVEGALQTDVIGGQVGDVTIKFYSGTGTGFLGDGKEFVVASLDGINAATPEELSAAEGGTNTNDTHVQLPDGEFITIPPVVQSGSSAQNPVKDLFEILPVSDTGVVNISGNVMYNTSLMITNTHWFQSNSAIVNIGDLTINDATNPDTNIIGLSLGTNAYFTNSGNTYVGTSGTGLLELRAGSWFQNAGNFFIDDNPGSTGTVTVSGGYLQNAGTMSIGVSGTGVLTISGTGVVESDGGIYLASNQASTGTLNFGTYGGSDSVLSNALITPSISLGSGTGTINFNQSNSYTLSVPISGHGTLNQFGAGTTILASSNSYSGSTVVNNGTLLVNNTNGSGTGSSTLTVNSGGTLGGTGTIGGNATITGTLAPSIGSTPSILSFSTNLTLDSTAMTITQIASTNNYDQIRVGGLFTLGGTLNLGNLSALSLARGDYTFNLFTDLIGNPFNIDQLAGDWMNVKAGAWNFTENEPNVWSYDAGGSLWQFSDATDQLYVNIVPEPSTYALFGLGLIACFMGRQTNGALRECEVAETDEVA